MKGKFTTLRFAACFLLASVYHDVLAGTALSEFNKTHRADLKKLGAGAEVVIHRFSEYQLVELYIPAGASIATTHDLQVKDIASEAYEQLLNKNTIAVIGGGFFGYDTDGEETPVGLLREDGVRKVALMPWTHGGVFTSDGQGSIRIYPANTASEGGRWKYALQSKPIIILNGAVDVAKNLRDADFNRVALGITRDGDILIVGLFNSFGQAGTLVQFSHIFKAVADKRNLKISRALSMDGGAGAQIHIPKLKMRFGDTGLSYFPNAIRFDVKTEPGDKK